MRIHDLQTLAESIVTTDAEQAGLHELWNPWSPEQREARQKIHAHKQLQRVYLRDKLARIALAKKELNRQAGKWKESTKAAHARYKLDIERETEARRLGLSTPKILKTDTTYARERAAQFGFPRERGRPRKDTSLADRMNDVIDVEFRDITDEPWQAEVMRQHQAKRDDFHIPDVNIDVTSPRLGKRQLLLPPPRD